MSVPHLNVLHTYHILTAKLLSSRVVSSEIYGGKFLEIYFNLSGNFLMAYVNQLLSSPALQSNAVK